MKREGGDWVKLRLPRRQSLAVIRWRHWGKVTQLDRRSHEKVGLGIPIRQINAFGWGLDRFLQTGAWDKGPGMQGGSPPGPDLVLTPPSGSGEAWAPSSSFSRFCFRT